MPNQQDDAKLPNLGRQQHEIQNINKQRNCFVDRVHVFNDEYH